MDAVTSDTLIRMIRDGAWIPLLAVVVGGIVRLTKTDPAVAWFKLYTRPEHRAYWALAIAMLGGFAETITRIVVSGDATGASLRDGLVGGLVAGMMAISGHEVVVEGVRKGRDFGVKKLPPPPATPWEDDSQRPPVIPESYPAPKIFPLSAAVLALVLLAACAAGKAIACPLLDLSAKVCPLIPVIMADGSQELVPRDRIADVAMRIRTERIAAEAKMSPCPKCTDGGTE